MLKKFMLSLMALLFVASNAFAQVDVNKATQAQLDGLKGIGPVKSKAILDERKKGDFKDWADFQARVNGIGDKTAADLSQGGLTINGKARPADASKGNDGKPVTDKKEGKKTAKEDKMKDTKALAKEEKAAEKDVKAVAKEEKKADKKEDKKNDQGSKK